MNRSEKNLTSGIFSSPIFFLVIIILVFAVLFYVFGSGNSGGSDSYVSTYSENENWKNSENTRGSADGKITILEYGDYECPACGFAHGTVNNILKEYESEVKLVYRHFPLPQHQYAFEASIAAECSGEQGKFWQMHDELFENQKKIKGDFSGFATSIGLDLDKFNQCFSSKGYTDKIKKNIVEGEKDNLRHTPTFFVNGKELDSYSIESFKEAIDSELGK